MTGQTNSEHYRRGRELAEAGRHREALEYIRAHLQAAPEDGEALNDAGAILHCLGRSDEAIDHLNRARRLWQDSAEILWNLSEAYIAIGRAEEAAGLFDDMERMGILNPDVLNRTATVFLDQGDKANALEMLLRSLEIAPAQNVLTPMVEVIRSKRPKIAFFCGGDGMTFLHEIIEFTKRRFEVRVFEGQTQDELFEMMRWSDISWFEWCTNLAVAASTRPKVCKNIVRLHRYEAYERWPGQVNLKRFAFVDRQRGKNIAFLGNLRMVKNPAFALQCMQKLHYIDPAYRLFFGGVFQDQVLEQYLRHTVEALGLQEVVFFDGWQDDVNAWLGDKHYIVSTSICEGHPVGILEGMACGLKPVVHNFVGAQQIFPSEFLFNISEEFCGQILSDTHEPRRYRGFVEQRYSLNRQLSGINEILAGLEAQIDSDCERDLSREFGMSVGPNSGVERAAWSE